MSIPPSEINSDWVLIETTRRIREIRDALPRNVRRIRWLVTPLPGQRYAIYRLGNLIEYLKKTTGQENVSRTILDQTLGDYQEFLKNFARPAFESTADWNTVKNNLPFVVLKDGAPIGIVHTTFRGGDSDINWLDNEPKSANGGSHAEPPMPGVDLSGGTNVTIGGDIVSGDITAPSEPPSPGPNPTPPPPPPPTLGAPVVPPASESALPPGRLSVDEEVPPPTPAPRKINARLIEHNLDTPLIVGETYKLGFSVQQDQTPAGTVSKTDFKGENLFVPGVEQVDLKVQLVSDDFEILTEPQKLIVPRTGKSRNEASFDISPLHDGECQVQALFFKDDRVLQGMTVKLNVAVAGQGAVPGAKAILETQTLGRVSDLTTPAKRRSMNIYIKPTADDRFWIQITSGGVWEATLSLNKQQLADAVGKARQVLENIVDTEDDKGEAVYQRAETTIPDEVYQETLPKLAEAGYILFRTIFLPRASDEATKALANFFRKQAQQEALTIQIISREMMLPWGILYMEDTFDPRKINPEMFLGARHIIEHLPFQPNMNFSLTIQSQPRLALGVNLNPDIDQQFKINVIENQVKYFGTLGQKAGIQLTTRQTGDDIFNAWTNKDTPDQIAYFYCHAKSLTEGGAEDNVLEFGFRRWTYTLHDFDMGASTDTKLPNSPLVFLNACESAELSPLFYDGFMPYFVDKGARGMIGTECSVPANFAAEFAERFFEEFFKGKPLGEVMLELRRDYLVNKHNVLGLLYALYCEADTQIDPPLAIS